MVYINFGISVVIDDNIVGTQVITKWVSTVRVIVLGSYRAQETYIYFLRNWHLFHNCLIIVNV